MKTLAQLAQDALDIQDASNLSGVVHSFSKACTDLREVMNNSPEGFSQERLHTHPIILAWVSKIDSLTGGRWTDFSVFPSVERIAKEGIEKEY